MIWISVFVAAGALQLTYWALLRAGFSSAARQSGGNFHDASRHALDPSPGTTPPSMSVIIAARNEENRLPVLLEALRRQTHPDFEVIVADDGSEDRTAEVVRSWQDRLPRLRLVCTDGVGKKRALAAGIEAASHELLALTDADCVPPPGWLSALSDAHAACADCVIVGYSPFAASESGTLNLLNRLARYETFVTGFLTVAAIGLGRPYMAVGRNLSYSRRVFREAGRFSAIEHSLSGDDDLFLQQIVRLGAARAVALLDPRSFVATESPATWREWIRQKRRHASGGRHYFLGVQAHLASFHATNALVWLAPIVVGWTGVGLLAAKLILQAVVLRRAAKVLGEEDQIRAHPLMEPLYMLYNLTIAPLGLAKMPERW